MGVEVGRDGELGVAESLGHDLEVDASGKGETGAGVTQVVEADRWLTGLLGEILEMSCDVLGAKRAPVLAGEDTAGVIPSRTPGRSLEFLGLSMALEHPYRVTVDLHDSQPTLRLWCADDASPVDVSDLLDDEEALVVEVDVFPA